MNTAMGVSELGRTAMRRAGAILKAVFTATAAMPEKIAMKRSARPMQAHVQCSRRNAERLCRHHAIFAVKIETLNQRRIRRSKIGHHTRQALTKTPLILGAFFAIFRCRQFQRKGVVQTTPAPTLSSVLFSWTSVL